MSPDVASLMSGLRGPWQAVYSEVDGEITPPAEFAATTMKHEGDKFIVEKKGAVAYEGSFSIDPTVTPHEIVYIYKKSAKDVFLGGPRPGIFQLEGDTFKVCFALIGHRTPKDFNTFPGSEQVLTVFQRSGKASAAPTTAGRTHGILW